jgi:hypothetical protein
VNGSRVQIEVGGLIMQTERLTILHEGQGATEFTTIGERVEVRSASGAVLRGKEISTSLRHGLLDYAEASRRKVDLIR